MRKRKVVSDDLRRFLHLMWLSKEDETPIAAVSLRAETAFDRVEEDFCFIIWSLFDLATGY